MDLKTCAFNKKIKMPFQQTNYTPEQIKEYAKCKYDINYFANNYFYLVTLDGGLQKMELYDWQEPVLQSFFDNRFNIVCASRQVGKTTLYTVIILHTILFENYKNVAILANKEGTVKEILKRVKRAYENLPLWMQQGVVVWNETSITLENESSIKVYATSGDNARSIAANMLIVDEVAFIRSTVWEEFSNSAFPTISSGTTSKIILVSTPNGMNHFYDLFMKAKLGKNKYKFFEIPYTLMIPYKDKEWLDYIESERLTKGDAYVEQEFNCKFLGASGTLVDGVKLNNILLEVTDSDYYNRDRKEYIEEFNNNIPELSSYVNNINIFEYPKPNHVYWIGGDTCTNSDESEKGDSTSIQVLDITELPFIQVCAAHFSEDTSYLEIPEIQMSLSELYNNAIICNENNDGSGREINLILNQKDCETLYWDNEKIAGFRTTISTKRIGCSNLKSIIEHNYLKINDKITVEQLFQFAKKGTSYKALKGFDDAVMALLASIYFLQISQEKYEEYLPEYYNYADVEELKKIILTTICGSIDISDTNNISFDNTLLNKKSTQIKNNLNQLLQDSNNLDYDLIMKRLERLKKYEVVIADINHRDNEQDEFENDMFNLMQQYKVNSNKDYKVSEDDFINRFNRD